jgi:hypothetical protein
MPRMDFKSVTDSSSSGASLGFQNPLYASGVLPTFYIRNFSARKFEVSRSKGKN